MTEDIVGARALGVMPQGILRRLGYRLHLMWKIASSRTLKPIIVDAFHQLYYGNCSTTLGNAFLGVGLTKCPLDLWVYQEIIHEIQPDVIVECGTQRGGTALFLASICGLIQRGRLITIDIEPIPNRPTHPRVRYLTGSSTAPEVVEVVKRSIAPHETVMVILDSDHHQAHVLQELRIYSDVVTPGSYLIVEDTDLNGHPVRPEFGPGPWEAVREFLEERDDFVIDRRREKFYLTLNPNGYLQKRRTR